MNLPEESISSWDELREQFIANFKATCERPSTIADLNAIHQKEGETLRWFI